MGHAPHSKTDTLREKVEGLYVAHCTKSHTIRAAVVVPHVTEAVCVWGWKLPHSRKLTFLGLSDGGLKMGTGTLKRWIQVP